MRNTSPHRTIFHRDGSITVWNCFTQNWQRTSHPSDRLLATMSEPERSRVIRHCGIQ
jgi:hypothetical protein